MNYNFTVDWFSHNAPTWKRMVSIYQPRHVLEIGSHEGRSACWLLDNWPLTSITCVDIWPDAEVERRFDANVKLALGKRQVTEFTKLKQSSAKALVDLLFAEARFDMIYIDGGHDAVAVLQDAVFAWPLLKIGGLLIFDDYLWTAPVPKLLDEPKVAIDAFTNIYSAKLKWIPGVPLYQIFVEKTAA